MAENMCGDAWALINKFLKDNLKVYLKNFQDNHYFTLC